MRKECLAVLCLLSVGGWSLAQDKIDPPKLLVSYDLKKAPTAIKVIELRPNTEQPVYLYLENPGPDTRRDLTVKLFKLLPDGATELLSTAKVATLKKDARERLIFGKPGPIPTDPKMPLPSLEGPPFQFQAWIEEGKEEPVKVTFGVRITDPKEYVEVTTREYDPDKQQVRVKVKALAGFSGPPCVVRLTLPEEANAGLNLSKTQGAFKQTLTAPGQEVELTAIGIAFNGPTPKTGRIYVGVDGYDRAFGYQNSFTKGTLQPLADGTRARIYGARFAPADGKYPVRLEVDNPPNVPVVVDVGLDRAGNGQFDSKLLTGFRDQSVKLHLAGVDGGLVFKTGLGDWQTVLDTTDVAGVRGFRVRLFTWEKGEKGAPVPLVDEQNNRDEALTLFDPVTAGRIAPLTFDVESKSVVGKLVIDITPPERLTFVNLPAKVVKGRPVALKASAVDELSDIQKVVFYAGKPQPDGKPPMGEPIVGVRTDKKPVWTAEVSIPDTARDKLDVTVQAFNGAGLSTMETVSIRILDDKGDGKKGNATIKGVVAEGPRPQPGIPVTLSDDKGKPKFVAKTNDKGEYKFENIPPGNYQVTAVRSASMTRGQLAVTVPEGKDEVTANIKLTR